MGAAERQECRVRCREPNSAAIATVLRPDRVPPRPALAKVVVRNSDTLETSTARDIPGSDSRRRRSASVNRSQGLFRFASGKQRVGLFRAIDHISRRVAAAVSKRHWLFLRSLRRRRYRRKEVRFGSDSTPRSLRFSDPPLLRVEGGAHRGQRLPEAPLPPDPKPASARTQARPAVSVLKPASRKGGRKTRRSPRDRCPRRPTLARIEFELAVRSRRQMRLP